MAIILGREAVDAEDCEIHLSEPLIVVVGYVNVDRDVDLDYTVTVRADEDHRLYEHARGSVQDPSFDRGTQSWAFADLGEQLTVLELKSLSAFRFPRTSRSRLRVTLTTFSNRGSGQRLSDARS